MERRGSFVLKNDISELDRLAQEVSSWCRENSLSEETDYKMNLVVDEIVSNVIRHGYNDGEDHEIVIKLSLDGSELTIQIEDDGAYFNPLQAPILDITQPIEERSLGGMGIYLVRQTMDSMEYRRLGGKNCLIMKTKTA